MTTGTKRSVKTVLTLAQMKKMIAEKEGAPCLKLSWISKPESITWPTGRSGVSAMIKVEASGFRATKFSYTEIHDRGTKSWRLQPFGHC